MNKYKTDHFYKNTLLNFNLFCAILFLLWYNTPIIRIRYSGGVFNIIIFIIIITWIVTSLLIKPSWVIVIPKFIFYLTCWLSYILLLALVNYGLDLRDHLLLLFSFWFIVYMTHFYLIVGNKKIKEKLLIYTLIIIFITLFTTFYGVLQFPNASKTMLNPELNLAQYSIFVNMNIGGYDFINGILMILPLSIYISFGKNIKLKVKFFSLISTFFIIMTLVNASYAISTILMLFAVIFSIALIKFKPPVVVIYSIILGFMIIIFSDLIINWLINFADFTNNSTLIIRFNELALFFDGYVSDGSPKYRLLALSNSFKTFLSHPIIGVGGIYYKDLNTIGAHSQWLDDLARFGIVGMIPFVSFTFSYIKYIRRIFYNTSFIKFYLLSIFTLLILGVVNPITSAPTISTVVFLLIPLIGDSLSVKN